MESQAPESTVTVVILSALVCIILFLFMNKGFLVVCFCLLFLTICENPKDDTHKAGLTRSDAGEKAPCRCNSSHRHNV